MTHPKVVLCDTEVDAEGNWSVIVVLANGRIGHTSGYYNNQNSAINAAVKYAGDASRTSNDLTSCSLDSYGGQWHVRVSTTQGISAAHSSSKKLDAIRGAIRRVRA